MSKQILHTLNQGPNQPQLLETLARGMQSQDRLLLIEDGVYWSAALNADKLVNLECKEILALKIDGDARGVQSNKVRWIDDAEFVRLTVECDQTMSWF